MFLWRSSLIIWQYCFLLHLYFVYRSSECVLFGCQMLCTMLYFYYICKYGEIFDKRNIRKAAFVSYDSNVSSCCWLLSIIVLILKKPAGASDDHYLAFGAWIWDAVLQCYSNSCFTWPPYLPSYSYDCTFYRTSFVNN